MKKGYLILLLCLFSIISVSAFEFSGRTVDINGGPLNATVVNISYYNISEDFAYVGSNSTLSNSSGNFNITLPDSNDLMFTPEFLHYNGSYVQHVGKSLPYLPSEVLSSLSGTLFFLQEAGTIIIKAVNQTGFPITFSYQVKDTKLGYEVAGNLAGNDYVSEAIVHVPLERNYSIMIFPNQSMPTSYGWTNFSSEEDYSFDNGNSYYNYTTATVNKTFNMTMSYARVNGYIGVDSIDIWEDLTIVPYILEPSSIAHATYGAIPFNLSAFFDGTSDYYNLSTGMTNFSGWYNISLPSTVEQSEMLLFAVAKNGSNYYGGFHNLSLDYNIHNNGYNYALNFTNMFELRGIEQNISLEGVFGPGTGKNVSTRLQPFNIVDNSSQTSTEIDAHIEAVIDYTDYGVKEFTWMEDIRQGEESIFYLPLLNITGVEEINVFANGGNYEPVRRSFTIDQIIENNNLTLQSFSPRDIDGGVGNSEIYVSFYRSNSTCDVPTPHSDCVEGASENMDNFDPISVIMGGGKLSFRMGLPSTGIEVHYVNVDMLASGPPAALFDDSKSESTSGSFASALRFGSNGPTIYDYVLVSIPYTEGTTSVEGLNESLPVNMSIPVFYDENWDVIWNASQNGTSGANLAGNSSHYEEYQNDWEVLMNASTCTENVSLFNATNPCYINKTGNRVWVRLPHFSGTGPQISASSTTTSGGGGGGDSGGSGGGGGSSSSGGGAATTYIKGSEQNPLNVSDLKGGNKQYIRRTLSKYIMNRFNETHKVTFHGLIGGKANITVESEPINLLMEKGDVIKLNLSSASEYDLQIELQELSDTIATLVLTEINEPNPNYVAPIVEAAPANESMASSGDEIGTSSGFSWVFIFYILFAIVIIAGVGYAVYWYMKKKQFSVYERTIKQFQKRRKKKK